MGVDLVSFLFPILCYNDSMGRENTSNIYVSLDEAREELKKRWADLELRKRVEKELKGDS
jgi:hypothetical protein